MRVRSFSLPLATKLLFPEVNREVAKWLETTPDLPPKEMIRELGKRVGKIRIRTWIVTISDLVDEISCRLSARLETHPPDELFDDRKKLIDALEGIESSLWVLIACFNDDEFRADYGIPWTDAIVNRYHRDAAKINAVILKIKLHDASVTDNADSS